MVQSLYNLFYLSALVVSFGFLCHADLVIYNFNITWVTANPDKAFDRPTIGINGHWPLPQITVTKGDRLIVNVNNQLGNQSTSLHFHGLYQNGTNQMDGAVGVTQCGILPGSSFTYNFTVDQAGTYWYHAHERGQYPDGIRGPFIVHDPLSPYKDQYDEEVVLTLSDWYHTQMPTLIASFINVKNPKGTEPIPDAALMNDTQNVTISVEPGKTYFFRMINMAAFAAQYVWFEGHTMQIIEVDGIYTEPSSANMIYIAAAQRYGVLVTARNDTGSNFAIVGSMDEALFDVLPHSLNPNVTGWLVYDDRNPLPAPALLNTFDPFDDFNLVPYDREERLDQVDRRIRLDMRMGNLGDGANYGLINNVSWVAPKVPTLYSVLSSGVFATNAEIYGVNTNSFVLKHNDVVEIIVNNNDPGTHPFHLHGHNFQAVMRSDDNAGFYDYNADLAEIFDTTLPHIPMRRDTLVIRPNGHFIIRFKADNPGVWLFHCHIEWHVNSGLIATMVEAPLEMQRQLSVPEDHWQVCRDSNTPTTGNAAANTKDFLDLTGANVGVGPLPDGFTARGIIALIFSCVGAFLGIAVISWYGAAPIGTGELASAKKTILQAGLDLK